MATSSAPQEMREAAPWLSLLAFLQGRNPYALETMPGPANLYGPLYPLAAIPFAWILGPGLPAMRLANAAFLLGAAALTFRLCRQAGGGATISALATALVLAGWLYWVGATVRPDGLGLLLMLAGYTACAAGPPAWRRFLPALVLWLLAFAAKIYFVFPAFVVAAWTAWRGQPRLGLAFAAAAVAGLAATMALLALLFPGWAAVVLGVSLGATVYVPLHLARQAIDWAIFSLPLLAGLAVILPSAGRRLLVAPRAISLWAFAAFAGIGVLVLRLGGHTGAHMTYFFHLLSPFAAIALAGAAGLSAAPRRAVAFAFPLAILLNAHWFPWRIGAFAAGEAGFAEAGRLIGVARDPLATLEFAPLLVAAGHAAPETGHTEYFGYGLQHPPPALLAPLWPPAALLIEHAQAASRAITDGIEGGRFDLVLTNPFGFGLIPRPLLQRHYAPAGTVPVRMPWAAQAWQAEIWRPRRQ